MPAKNQDLHGNVPDKASVALLLVDVINDFEFEGAELIIDFAIPMAKNLAELKHRAKAAGVPCIYVNDNYGKWQSDWGKLVKHCLEEGVRGRPVVELLQPDEDDYFVLKPKHSGFFSTVLDVLLTYLQVKTLVITGVAGNICILFTANDAYMRDFDIYVPSDCVASNYQADNDYALRQMHDILKAEVRPSTEINWQELKQISSKNSEQHPQSDEQNLADET